MTQNVCPKYDPRHLCHSCQALGGAAHLSHLARHSSFFNKVMTADELWRGVLAESGVGARKGRGKRTKCKMNKDLNRGQNLGEGRAGYLWPGLNTPVYKDGSIQKPSQRGETEQKEVTAALERQRDEWDKRRKTKIKRERDFDSHVIEVKRAFNVTAKESRKRSISSLVAVGNGNGAAGKYRRKKRAMHYLYYTERYNNHTSESHTTLCYGLRCHWAVITLCKLIGIEDMYAKVDGSVPFHRSLQCCGDITVWEHLLVNAKQKPVPCEQPFI
uniref:Mitochondrial ribosomal protein S5 n=1 Tax=Cyprinus carpio TaxID=7962 RepID=A0A8C1Z9Q1_CYPCA